MGDAVEAITSRGCFVAGTLVRTAEGLVPIECVRPGDLVLAKSEETGEVALKPVKAISRTRPELLWTLSYGTEDQKYGRITGTAEHPFFVAERQEFVPMAELNPGDSLELVDGGTATVMDIRIERGPPALWGDHADTGEYTTYNLEIADFHTYFVGVEGIWVHNLTAPCRGIFSRVGKLVKTMPVSAYGRRPWLNAFKETVVVREARKRAQWLRKHPGQSYDPNNPPWDFSDDEKYEMIDGLMHQIMDDAAPLQPNGLRAPADFRKAFSYDEWDQMFRDLGSRWSRLTTLEVEVNHGGPKEIVEAMFDNAGMTVPSLTWLNANTPSFPFLKYRHSKGAGRLGTYRTTFHDVLRGHRDRHIPGLLPNDLSTYTPRQMRDAIKNAFAFMQHEYSSVDDVDYDLMGKIVDNWCDRLGF